MYYESKFAWNEVAKDFHNKLQDYDSWIHTAKNILGIAHPKHSILLLVSRILEGDSGYFALLVASNQIYCLSEIIFLN